MSKIKIKNFGPIREGYQGNDGWMDVKKVTVFIGNQGSGKSSVAKLISTFAWIEKVLTRGDYPIKNFITYNRFRKIYCYYHRIHNYFFDFNKIDVAEIEYHGDSFTMKYSKGYLTIDKNENGKYQLPQTMYVPAERNFISTVRSPKLLKISSESLNEFHDEYVNALNEIKGSLRLPINNADVEYDRLNDNVNIKGVDYRVRLSEASSGFQSLVPLYLVSWYLSNKVKRQSVNPKEPMSSDESNRFKKEYEAIWSNNTFTDQQRRIALSVLSSKFNKEVFINIVEEPEQNLFPISQQNILNSLLEFNNMIKGNKLIMTTHSPYIINYLTLAVKANSIKEKFGNNSELLNKLDKIVPIKSTVNSKGLVLYEIDEKGEIIKLADYEGLPSDENYLNLKLEENNELFSSMLEIEDLCQ